MAENLATGYKAMFYLEGLTHLDSVIVNIIENNAKRLADVRQDYLNTLAQDWADQEYVLADFMMVTTDADPKTGHPAGEPKPIIRTDPFGVKRIYYPMMANDYAPVDKGYALETGQPKQLKTKTYINDDNVNKNQYWYYALAPKNETPGIQDIIFYPDKGEFCNIDGKKYIRRGESSKTGIKWNDAEDMYVYIHYYDETKDSNNPVTAVELRTYRNNLRIANTGGAELAPGGSTQTQIYNEWNSRNWDYSYRSSLWFNNAHEDSKFKYGWNIRSLRYTQDPLRIKSIKEIHQPKRWGE